MSPYKTSRGTSFCRLVTTILSGPASSPSTSKIPVEAVSLVFAQTQRCSDLVVAADFMDDQVLQPFTGADSFTPGSGLGLRLAQRMIELLGGKLAIASTPGKGTLVHIEVPLQLFNEDNESDLEELDARGDQTSERGSGSGGNIHPLEIDSRAHKIRQDGIYLVGFDVSPAMKRVGKSLLRLLKMNFCRVVPDIQYAGLIVAPDGTDQNALLRLAGQARSGVEIVLIGERLKWLDVTARRVSGEKIGGDRRAAADRSENASDALAKTEEWDGIAVRHVLRPVRPSALNEIMRPTQAPMGPPGESFVSPVVGGENRHNSSIKFENDRHQDGFDWNRGNSNQQGTTMGSLPSIAGMTEEDILPSPNGSPVLGAMKELPPSIPLDASVMAINSDLKGLTIEPVAPYLAEAAAVSSSEPTSTSESRVDSGSDSVSSDRIDIDESLDGSKTGRRPVSASVSAAPSSSAVSTSPEVTEVLRVLVVEDNDVNRKIITTMLRKTKCDFSEARDGDEAVEQFKATRPHLILLDINMPRKDGFQAATEIRALERGKRRPKLTTHGSMRSQRSRTSPEEAFTAGQTQSIPLSPVSPVTPRASSQPHSPVTTTGTFSPQSQPSTGAHIPVKTRIVAVTAMSSEAHRRKGIVECGIDVWLSKPVGIKAMREVIENAKEELLGDAITEEAAGNEG